MFYIIKIPVFFSVFFANFLFVSWFFSSWLVQMWWRCTTWQPTSPSCWSTWRPPGTRCRCRATGASKESTCRERGALRSPRLSCRSSSGGRESRRCEKLCRRRWESLQVFGRKDKEGPTLLIVLFPDRLRRRTPNLWKPKWGRRFDPRWGRLTLTTRSSTMLSSNGKLNLNSPSMETFTMRYNTQLYFLRAKIKRLIVHWSQVVFFSCFYGKSLTYKIFALLFNFFFLWAILILNWLLQFALNKDSVFVHPLCFHRSEWCQPAQGLPLVLQLLFSYTLNSGQLPEAIIK